MIRFFKNEIFVRRNIILPNNKANYASNDYKLFLTSYFMILTLVNDIKSNIKLCFFHLN